MAERNASETASQLYVPNRTADVGAPSNRLPDEALPYRSLADEPTVLRKETKAKDKADELLLASRALARRARDAFKEACESTDADEAEASFLAVKQSLTELADYLYLRDRAFRDLLGLLAAATRHVEFSAVETHQRDALSLAFADLPRMFLDDSTVEQHIDCFAEHGIDEVLRPVNSPKQKRLKITIEEVEEVK